MEEVADRRGKARGGKAKGAERREGRAMITRQARGVMITGAERMREDQRPVDDPQAEAMAGALQRAPGGRRTWTLWMPSWTLSQQLLQTEAQAG